MVRAQALAAVIAVALLAGCLGPATDDEERLAADVLAGRIAPTWQIGQYWMMDAAIWNEVTLVVTGEADGEWIMGTTDADLAWFHHRDEVSFLGEIRKEDLAGSQGGERVRFLDFPLELGKNWTTQWGEGERRIEVATVGETFTLEGYDDDHFAVIYEYDPRIGWFTDMEYYDEDGTIAYKFTLLDHGHGFNGTLAHWTTGATIALGGDSPIDLASFSVGAETQDLFLAFTLSCEGEQGLYSLQLHHELDPAGGHVSDGGCTDVADEIVLSDPEHGTWNLRFEQLFLPGLATYEIEVWTRSLHWVELEA